MLVIEPIGPHPSNDYYLVHEDLKKFLKGTNWSIYDWSAHGSFHLQNKKTDNEMFVCRKDVLFLYKNELSIMLWKQETDNWRDNV